MTAMGGIGMSGMRPYARYQTLPSSQRLWAMHLAHILLCTINLAEVIIRNVLLSLTLMRKNHVNASSFVRI